MRTAKQAAQFFKDKTTNKVGMCLWHVQDAFQSPHVYPNAITQWHQAKKKHAGDRTPKIGAPVYFEGGKHGHIAIYIGDGRVRSTDAGGAGRMGTASIDWFVRNWNMKYLGWTEDIGGWQINFEQFQNVYVRKLKPGVNDSDSVRMLRLALIRRGFLKVSKPLSEKRPGNRYTPAVEGAVKRWQDKHGFRKTGVLTNVQAKQFFSHNQRVKLHLERVHS